MSVDNIKFFLSSEQECNYLPGEQSASIFADPEGIMTTEIYSILINHGFRRSADYVYRPHCPQCQECKSARIPVEQFKPTRSQKRVIKKNSFLSIQETTPHLSEEHFELYKKYMKQRHKDGEMDHNDPDRYFDFLNSAWCDTKFIEFRLNEKLISVAVVDFLRDGLSALYTFFDPKHSQLSPGTFAVLWQIQRAIQLDKKYVYLGYWIKDCEKMNYKINFKPLEILDQDQWHLHF